MKLKRWAGAGLVCLALAACGKSAVVPQAGAPKAANAAAAQNTYPGKTPEAQFAWLDTNRDSQLSGFELSRAFGRPVGASPEPQQGGDLEALAYLMQAYDTGKNGMLDINEFRVLATRLQKPPTGPVGVFDYVDVNKDGSLSFAELYLAPFGNPAGGGWTRDQQRLKVMQLFVKADANGDGQLSREEFNSGIGNEKQSGAGVAPVQGS